MTIVWLIASGLVLNEPLDQPIDLAGSFHMRQVSGLLENVNREAWRERLSVGDRDDAVLAAPDDLRRQSQRRDGVAEADPLPAAGKPFLGNPRQRRRYAVEPFVAQHILDHCAANQCRVVDQQAEYLDC